MSFKLQEDIKKAVEANDMQLLKILLQNKSLKFGVLDDAAVHLIMATLRTQITHNPGAAFRLNKIVTVVESK